jgi:hypothetical protein
LPNGKWQKVDADPAGNKLQDLQAVMIDSYRKSL